MNTPTAVLMSWSVVFGCAVYLALWARELKGFMPCIPNYAIDTLGTNCVTLYQVTLVRDPTGAPTCSRAGCQLIALKPTSSAKALHGYLSAGGLATLSLQRGNEQVGQFLATHEGVSGGLLFVGLVSSSRTHVYVDGAVENLVAYAWRE